MRLLLVNDDGFGAVGIKTLEEQLIVAGHEVLIVAPDSERSASGHGLSLFRDVTLTCHGKDRYSCSGFPADSTFMALHHIYKDNPPDLVISGINYGANLAQDTFYSGTVAAAREASFVNIPAIAVSLVVPFEKKSDSRVKYFSSAANYIVKFLSTEEYKKIPPRTILNINVPNLPDDQILPPKLGTLGFRKYGSFVEIHNGKYFIKGDYQGFEDRDGKSDCEIVETGHISVTALRYDLGVVNESIRAVICSKNK